ncbi:cytochrome P450 [Nocardioides silvaticus]|uniref:Cytochrome P450 n=1 Tax=Nocardioides silvaticus TaxID=2201891 RepID=A0A316TQD4_9ACTN|nr:cytochrome P450 [Nocardioides silvaticus]PWN04434.1 cytochrome P450 [Nocardioides silvaticus]
MRPTLLHFPGDRLLEAVQERVGTRPVPLAEPPAGSGLRPVLGEVGLPVLGKTVELIRDAEAAARRYRAKYGDVFWTRAFGTRSVWVMGPDAVQEVVQNKDKVYSQSGWEFFIGPFFTRGLMLLDGEEHHLHRRIMQEAFTRPRLEGYQTKVQSVIDRGVPAWPTDRPMRLYPAIKQLSLDVATEVFMGAEPSAETHALTQAFIDTVRAGTGLIRAEVPVLNTRWNRGLAGRRQLEAYFRRLIPTKRASRDTDLFSALCHIESEEGVRFTDDDVVNHMIFLMMAAHDTSTITATAMAFYFAKHPDWQEQAREESFALGTDRPTIEQLESLATLDLVFKEAMRLVAPVPALVRRTTADTALDGHYVPKGTIINVAPGGLHLLGDHWVNGDDFDPTRFADPRTEHKAHRFGYVPFGGGAHKCIGMAFGTNEVKTLMHTVLTRYRLEVPPDYEIEWDHTALLVPTDEFPVTLRALAPRPAASG